MVRATSPSVVFDPDAVDMESAEEGWRSEDPQRRGVATRNSAGVLSGPGGCAAPPACYTATRDVARSGAPHRCRPAPRRRRAHASFDVVDDARRFRRSGAFDLANSGVLSESPDRGGRPRTSDACRQRVVSTGAAHHDDHRRSAASTPGPEDGGGRVGLRSGRPQSPGAIDPQAGGSAASPRTHLDRVGVVVRRSGRYLREPDAGVRDGGDGHRRGDRGSGPLHRGRPRGAQPGAGHRPGSRHVLPAGEPRGRGHRGTPELVSAPHLVVGAPCRV